MELRPATMIAVSTGPSSRTSVKRDQRAGLAHLPVLREARDICSAITAPLKNPIMTTIGSDCPRRSRPSEEDVVAVMRAAEDVLQGPSGEQEKLLNRKNRLFQQIEQVDSVPALRCYHITGKPHP